MKPNQRVAVEIASEGELSRFPSRVEDVGAETVTLAGPTERGQPVRLASGTSLRVVLFHEGSVQAFDTVVVESELYPVPLLTVRRPQRLIALQRRRYFREPAVVRTLCRRNGGDEHQLEGYTRNLSGGGFALRTKQLDLLSRMLEDIEGDEPLWIEVQLPDRPLQALATLAWWSVSETEHLADLAFEFVDLAEVERERLIRHLFTLQRNALKRGVA
jgi:c-di-GMP-binding flagellar brake protein YcgR